MSMRTRLLPIVGGVAILAVVAVGCAEQVAPSEPASAGPSALASPAATPTPPPGTSDRPLTEPPYVVPTTPIPAVVPNNVKPMAYALVAATATGPGMSPQAALAQALTGMNPTASFGRANPVVLKAQIAASPPGSQYRSGPWFYATISCPVWPRGGCVEATWEGDLLAGATAELMNRSAANLADVLVGATVQLQLPDGSLTGAGSGVGQAAAFQQFPQADATDPEIISQVDDLVRKDGLEPVSVTVFRPAGPAVAVVVKMPASGMPDGVTLNSLDQDLDGVNFNQYSGLYLELDTAVGTPIGATAGSARTASGVFWEDPRYHSIMGITTGGVGHATH